MNPLQQVEKLEELGDKDTDVRRPTPERDAATKRPVEPDIDTDMTGQPYADRGRSSTNGAEVRRFEGLRLDRIIPRMSAEDRRIVSLSIWGVVVAEIYLPERVAAVAFRFGLKRGYSLDLPNGWGICKPGQRAKAFERVRREQPYCVIGLPPCTKFSLLQELTKATHGRIRCG